MVDWNAIIHLHTARGERSSFRTRQEQAGPFREWTQLSGIWQHTGVRLGNAHIYKEREREREGERECMMKK